MPLDSTNWPQSVEAIDETTALLPPQAASDATTRLLIRARGYVQRGWCRHVLARDANGREVEPTSEHAVEWCAYGALAAAGMSLDPHSYFHHPATRRLIAALDAGYIAHFNNTQETVEPVLAAFDKAIGLIEFVAEGEAFDRAIAVGMTDRDRSAPEGRAIANQETVG